MRKFTVDLPDDLNSILETEAKANRRSLGQQIVFLLEGLFPKPADPSEVLNKKEAASD